MVDLLIFLESSDLNEKFNDLTALVPLYRFGRLHVLLFCYCYSNSTGETDRAHYQPLPLSPDALYVPSWRVGRVTSATTRADSLTKSTSQTKVVLMQCFFYLENLCWRF